MNNNPKAIDGFLERLQKPLPIAIIAVNGLAFVAAGRDMIHGVFKLDSYRTGHNVS